MLVGVVALVASAVVGNMVADMLVAQQEQATGRAITYQTFLQVAPQDLEAAANKLSTRFDPTRSSRVDGALISIHQTMWVRAQGDASVAESPPVGTEWLQGNPLGVRRLPVLKGIFPLPDAAFPPVLAVNEAAARLIGPSEQLKVSDGGDWRSFQVGAVIADGSREAQVYGTLAAYEAYFRCPAQCQLDLRLTVGDVGPETIKGAVNDAVTDLSPLIQTPHQDPARYDTVWTVADQTRVLSTVFAGVAMVMLVIAALGILNVGLSSMRERTGELVIRRAVGATRMDVFSLVVGSALVMALVVAALAIGVAIVGVYSVVPRLIPDASAISPPAFPWRPCLIGVLASGATAILGSAAPAVKAARLPVALALRV